MRNKVKKKQNRKRNGDKARNSIADEHSIVTTSEVHDNGDIAKIVYVLMAPLGKCTRKYNIILRR